MRVLGNDKKAKDGRLHVSYMKEHFELLDRIAKAIAAQFGPQCETVLHDMTLPYDHTIIAIHNGNVTGRKVGGSGTNLGLEILRGTRAGNDQLNYMNKLPDGRLLKSSSVYFKDDTGKTVGSLCINFDITDFLSSRNALSNFINMDKSSIQNERFSGDIDDLLERMVQDAIARTNVPVDKMTRANKIEVIRYLDQHGAFLIMKSMDKVAALLHISKYSIYNYLETIKNENKEASNREKSEVG